MDVVFSSLMFLFQSGSSSYVMAVVLSHLSQIVDGHLGGGRLCNSDEMEKEEGERVSVSWWKSRDGVLNGVY